VDCDSSEKTERKWILTKETKAILCQSTTLYAKMTINRGRLFVFGPFHVASVAMIFDTAGANDIHSTSVHKLQECMKI
jgi:hypothetical protein